MLLTITLILSFLVCVNFVLLIFSCNKTTKRAEVKEIKPTRVINTTTTQQPSTQLAPTGS